MPSRRQDWATTWNQSRVFPYVQMHEFEGLLFTDAEAFTVCAQRDAREYRTVERTCSRRLWDAGGHQRQ